MSYLLLTHLLTALLTLLLSSYAWLKPSKKLQSVLVLLTLASLISGIFIHLDRGVITPTYCAKIGIYLFIVLSTQVMLHHKLRKDASVTLHIK